jgi:hypothetical protein
MKTNHILGIALALAVTFGTSSAVFAKNNLPWPYNDRAMNNLAVQIYTQQQAEKAALLQGQNLYNPYANPYANPYLNPYVNQYNYNTAPGYYGAMPYGGWY